MGSVSIYDKSFDLKQVQSIFNNNVKRSLFISEYILFRTDGNLDFYKSFIDKYIFNSKKYKFQEDAIELSLSLGEFNQVYSSAVSAIIRSKRSDWIKLCCLDWLLNFYAEIDQADFIMLNKHAFKYSKNELVKVQALINLLLYNTENEFLPNLELVIRTISHSSTYYRIVNGLSNVSLTNKISYRTRDVLTDHISKNDVLSALQKNELLELLPHTI